MGLWGWWSRLYDSFGMSNWVLIYGIVTSLVNVTLSSPTKAPLYLDMGVYITKGSLQQVSSEVELTLADLVYTPVNPKNHFTN